MQGLELSKRFYEEYGKPMLENSFPELMPYIAVGCVGSGSDRYGFDDTVSQDHDFEPGFTVFLPSEEIVDRRSAFLLERAYSKLPKEFCGFIRQQLAPVGGNRNGIVRTSDFYSSVVGCADGVISYESWLHMPDYALAEATNGEVFYDGYGEFTAIRNKLLSMPEDVKLKRLAGNLLIMAQSGQYNFSRCIQHGEPEAAQLAANEFVTATLKVLFLLNDRYMPYYKWSFRAWRKIDTDSQFADRLSFILFGDNYDKTVSEDKYDIIEGIASEIIGILQEKDMTKAICGDLEKHAYSVNDKISDNSLRNMNILSGI